MRRNMPDLDADWVRDVAKQAEAAYRDIVGSGEKASQVEYVLAADNALDAAVARYALGAPVAEVREGLRRAAGALMEVFRLRGTTPAFPVTFVSGGRASTPSGAADESLTNSRRGLLAMQLALIAAPETVREITGLVGDPPNAPYIGQQSEVCTPAEQNLAYALRAYLFDRHPEAAFHAAGITDVEALLYPQALALQSLVARDADALKYSLSLLMDAHSDYAESPENSREPRRLLNIGALAFAALGLRERLVECSAMHGDAYFPVELLIDCQEALT